MARRLVGDVDADGALLADPVFEPTFGWQECDQTMASLAGTRLLHRKLAKAMASPPSVLAKEPTDYSFPPERRPFVHQIATWEILSDDNPKSVVITSGTGSGKTECFLVPVLNDLANLIDKGGSTEGVRALFIYPLNALINSQQNRLDAWTHEFKGQIRHCLYTGALPEQLRASDRVFAGQVIDRRSLRDSPPQIVVTNATMLEYMLIRPEDKPLLDKSAGKLRWIILDEAHTHIGSQAAEMALLLRRVMLAFKVDPRDVRFVATSATFGNDDETVNDLRQFLADMGGISPEQVHVVQGQRSLPNLQLQVAEANEFDNNSIRLIDENSEVSQNRHEALISNQYATQFRKLFVADGRAHPRSLSDLCAETKLSKPDVLRWLDLLSGTKDQAGNAYLPLRIHLFHNVISSIRVCVDKQCAEKAKKKDGKILDAEEWPYGMVYFGEWVRCDCGAPLFPLISCNECNEIFLEATVTTSGVLADRSQALIDEFSIDTDFSEDEMVEVEDSVTHALITNRRFENCSTELLDKTSDRLVHHANDADSNEQIPLEIFFSSGPECPSCRSKSNRQSLFRHARIGSPFTLSQAISTLLEFCPPDQQPLDKPFQGRKLISFTDSRQGTARIAIKLQQDSERNRIRGLVYQLLAGQDRPVGLSEEELKDLNYLEELEANGKLGRLLKPALRELRDRRDGPLVSPRCKWENLVDDLKNTPTVQNDMLAYYRDLAPKVFNDTGSRNLAGMLLAREFYRRPKRANNLETLGLVHVCYPGLDQINETPDAWPETVEFQGQTKLDSYKSYLKVLLDFFVRENTVITIDDQWQRLIGAKVHSKSLLGPLSPGSDRPTLPPRHIRWPSVNRNAEVQSRAVLLLCKAFNWNPKNETHSDSINSILDVAWSDLVKAKLLKLFDESYKLTLEQLSFSIPDQVYFCPITRRFIDTPFMSLTPYTPRTQRGNYAQVKPIKLPMLPPGLLTGDADTRRLKVRDWLESNLEIQALRENGEWFDIADLVLEGGSYFKAAEHSAQQPKTKLVQYETAFKNGKLNLLSCSTTMEMGVDIGGINVVAMNNVPPHPANYLQRAGRAGRRKEGRAVALTICKNTPHDQGVFNNPKWAFETPMRMPRVSLLSANLVQRHVNAWLLSYWLKEVAQAENLRSLKAGEFFVNDDRKSSLAKQFHHWAQIQTDSLPDQVAAAIKRVTSRTGLQGMPYAYLIQRTCQDLKIAADAWMKEYDACQEQVGKFVSPNDPARRATEAQLKRISSEYLLTELATRRFLPGYGFPTDIVSFDNKNITDFETKTDRRFGGLEDNRGQYRQLASRDRVTALREYVPGAQVVMDGLVYRSAGITLNWHIPAAETDVVESQLIRRAWHCGHCGAKGTLIQSWALSNCPECSADISGRGFDYLVPAGFAVNFFEEPETDISRLQFVAPEQPWLSVPGNWVSMANPGLGKFRASDRSSLFHFSQGANRNNFAVCLECGLTEPMLGTADPDATANEQYLPKSFRAKSKHKRLRGGKNSHGDQTCAGSDNTWKIKSNIALGHDSQTDAFELVLKNPTSNEYRHDSIAGYSIAVSLREAIAQHLGVQSEELGCECVDIRLNGSVVSSIRVFDLRSGGYASQAAEALNDRQLWERVISRLNCDCAQACQRCLLSFDTRFEIDRLDRHKALQWINDSWLELLKLPDELKVFGVSSTPEIVTIGDAIERELNRDDEQKGIRLYLAGTGNEWDLALARRLRRQILRWQYAEHKVEIWIPEFSFNSLDADQKSWLSILANNEVSLICYSSEPNLEPLVINASVHGPNNAKAWASDNLNLRIPDQSWDLISAGSRVVAGSPPNIQVARLLQPQDLSSQTNSAVTVLEISDELNGSIKRFSTRFWDYLKKNSHGILNPLFDGTDSLDELVYSDRYVRNPLVVNLIAQVILNLKKQQKEQFDVKIVGRKYSKDDPRRGYLAWHDWPDDEVRDRGIKEALAHCGLTYTVTSQPNIPHSRQMRLKLLSGKTIVIQLDQGFSFWGNDREQKQTRRSNLRVSFDAKDVGVEIMEKIDCDVVRPADESTQIFVFAEQG